MIWKPVMDPGNSAGKLLWDPVKNIKGGPGKWGICWSSDGAHSWDPLSSFKL